MTEANQSIAIENLTHEEAIARANALVPKIRERAPFTEANRMQPKETIQELKEAGLIRLLQPKRWGGHELGPETLFRTGIEIAKADPSAGWCYVLLVLHSWMLASFPEEAQKEIWGADPNATMSSSFTQTPNNTAVKVDGGFIVNGEWGYSSGIDHCDWALILGTVYPKAPEDKHEYYMMAIPKSDFEVLAKWKTVAQRGTGSNNILLNDVFVPAHRTIDMIPWCQSGDGPGHALNTNKLYRVPLYATLPMGLTTATLGASLGAYDLWVDGLRNKNTLRGSKIAEFTHQQIRVAEVAGKLEAAEALMEKTLRQITDADAINLYEKMKLRRNYGIIARMCNEAVKTIADNAGAAMIYETNPLQRYWRDVQVSSMHYTFNMDWLGEMFGKLELGVPLSEKDLLMA